MPIQLQNHRTSNAKLFSVTSNKQKLHTATSLQQTHKSNLKVSKHIPGNGLAMVARIFTNPTKATPNLPDAPPTAGGGGNRRRRHSLSGQQSLPPGTPTSTAPKTPENLKKAMRRSGSLDASLCVKALGEAFSLQPPSLSRARSHGNSSSHSRSFSPKATQSAHESRSRRRHTSSSKKLRKSSSFASASASPERKPSRRDRRGSGDSEHTTNTAPQNYPVPQSPRATLRAKREQMRRKSMGSHPVPMPKIMPPTTMVNLLDPSDDDASVDSMLSGWS